MTPEEMNTAIYHKMEAEQDSYRDWLLTLPPDEILQHAYEYAVRQDILFAMEDLELQPEQCRALMKSPCPVADVLRDFEKLERGYMETIRDCIEGRVDKLLAGKGGAMMPYVDAAAIEAARQIDLLSYLQAYEPGELVHVSGSTYCTREHDSLKISNGKWHWFSRGIGGRNALDYLVKVKEMPFPEAVSQLTGTPLRAYTAPKAPVMPKERRLLLPDVDSSCDAVKAYLEGRGIHPEIIDYCIEKKLLFQTSQYKNALFVGYDRMGKPHYGALRSTFSRFKSEATGSDKHYSFSIAENPQADTVHLFEAAIDLLSYATLEKYAGRDWKQEALLSLAGVFAPKRQGVVPVALSRFLEEHPQVTTLRLHLDNDEVGRAAAQGILDGLKGYTVLDEPPTRGKDVNEQLQLQLGLMKKKEEWER